MLSQITNLLANQGEAQDKRLATKIGEVQKVITSSVETFEVSRAKYSGGMDAWNVKEAHLVDEVLRSRETLKCKLKEDWVAANKHNSSLQVTTRSVHDETVRIVDMQMKDIETQMQALDDFVTRARSQNAQHHDSHVTSLGGLSTTVRSSYADIGSHFTSTYERVRDLGEEMSVKTGTLQESLTPLDSILREPLAELRSTITNSAMHEYQPTGATPQKVQYQYPSELPRTEPHEALLATLRRPITASPTKLTIPVIFNDATADEVNPQSEDGESRKKPTSGLREINANINAGSLNSLELHRSAQGAAFEERSKVEQLPQMPSFKRSMSGRLPMPKSAKKTVTSVVALEGRENERPSTGRRRSPRTG